MHHWPVGNWPARDGWMVTQIVQLPLNFDINWLNITQKFIIKSYFDSNFSLIRFWWSSFICRRKIKKKELTKLANRQATGRLEDEVEVK